MLKRKSKTMLTKCLTAIIATIWLSTSSADPLNSSIKIEKSVDRAAAVSQKKIDSFSDQTFNMAGEYKLALQKIDSLRAYNGSLRKLVRSQQSEMSSIQKQMDGIDATERDVIPMMDEMITVLGKFVEQDVPFLLKERTDRVSRLRTNMLRADTSNSEKYRLILEAYSVENDYGSSIGTYQDVNSEGTAVNYLRFGRLALLYQTLDEKETYVWNKSNKGWEQLDDQYRSSVRKGIRMAQGKEANDLIMVPVNVAETAR